MIQIKHPAFRARSISLVDQATLIAIADKMEQFVSLTPFAHLVTDINIVGSYARGCAELHSDLDINLDTGTEENRLLARDLIRQNKSQFAKAIAVLQFLQKQYGMRFEIALQHASMKEVPKMSYSLRTRTLFGTERRKMDVDWQTGEATERQNQPDPADFSLNVGVFDLEDGSRPFDPAKDDPWKKELPTWRTLYGANLLEYGNTPETS